jgi:hypothetical protein
LPIIDELITVLGFDTDDSGAKQFQTAMGGVKKTVTIITSAILAAEAAVVSYSNKVAAGVDELGKFSASFGVSSQRIQQFEFATERAGGSAEDLRSDIASMTKALASPIPGEFNQGLFMLGINVKDATGNLKSADQVLLDLSERFAGLDAKQRQILATQVGLSESTLRFISQGREEIERLSEKAIDLGGIIPGEATEIAAEYADRLTDVKFALGGISKTIAIAILPGMSNALSKFEEWIIANREFVTQNVQATVEGIGRGFSFVFSAIESGIDLVKSALPALDGLGDKIDIARLIAIGLVTALSFLAVAFSPLLLKIAAISAAISALILIIDDFIAFVQGKRSLIGTLLDAFLEKFPLAKTTIAELKSIFEGFVSGIGPLISSIGLLIVDTFKAAGDETNLFGATVKATINVAIAAINIFLGVVKNVIDVFSALIALFSGDFQAAAAIVKDLLGRNFEFVAKIIDGIITNISTLIGKVGEFTGLWGDVSDQINTENIAKAGLAIGEASKNILGTAKDFWGKELSMLAKSGNQIGSAVNSMLSGINLKEIIPDEFTIGIGTTPAFAGNVPVAATGAITNNQKQMTQTNNNTFNINGAQSPQAVANAIVGVQARHQSSLSTAAQTGAYPGLE